MTQSQLAGNPPPAQTTLRVLAGAFGWTALALVAAVLSGLLLGLMAMNSVLPPEERAIMFAAGGALGASIFLLSVVASHKRWATDYFALRNTASCLALVGLVAAYQMMLTRLLDLPSLEHGQMFAVLVVIVCVVSPICEETFFRGFLWEKMEAAGGVRAAALWTSVLWLWIHVNPAHILLLVPVAAALAVIRIFSGGTPMSILAHMVLNLIAAFNL
jgi:membrane protease YdiL (CAAX protease family)